MMVVMGPASRKEYVRQAIMMAGIASVWPQIVVPSSTMMAATAHV